MQKLQKKVVKVDFTRQVKKSVGETSSIKRIEYVEDTNCEEITVEKCLPVLRLNQRGSISYIRLSILRPITFSIGSFSSPSNLYNNYQGTRNVYDSDGSLSHPGPKVHQEVQQDDRRDRLVEPNTNPINLL